MRTVRILAPHFVAGVLIEDGVVTQAAPIIKYMAQDKWTIDEVLEYCMLKQWSYEDLLTERVG